MNFLFSLVWINVFACLILVCKNYKYVISNSGFNTAYTNKNQTFLLFMCIVVYSVFAFAEADTYHYAELFKLMKLYNEPLQVEPLHFWIIQIMPSYYWLWRMVIWGTATILTIQTFNKFSVDIKIISFLVALFFLQSFAITRGNLGLALLYYGVSLIMFRNGVKELIIGVFLILVSYYFHRTMIIAIVILPVMFLRLSKINVISSLLLFPFFSSIIGYFIEMLASGSLNFGEDKMALGSRGEMFANEAHAIQNLAGMLQWCLHYVPSLLLLYVAVRKVVFMKIKVPWTINSLFTYWYALTYISYLFNFQDSSSFMFSRINAIGIVPQLIVLSWLFKNTNLTKLEKKALQMGIIYCIFFLFYFMWKLPQQGYVYEKFF